MRSGKAKKFFKKSHRMMYLGLTLPSEAGLSLNFFEISRVLTRFASAPLLVSLKKSLMRMWVNFYLRIFLFLRVVGVVHLLGNRFSI